jgi:hypothetical protein
VVSKQAVQSSQLGSAYLVPVLLHTAFCSLREGLLLVSYLKLESREPSQQTLRRGLYESGASTFAISLQLLPASLIVLSLCSSAAVHGVFVRLFLALGSCEGGSTSAPAAAVAPPDGVPAGGAALAIWSCARLTDLRFFECPGVGG